MLSRRHSTTTHFKYPHCVDQYRSSINWETLLVNKWHCQGYTNLYRRQYIASNTRTMNNNNNNNNNWSRYGLPQIFYFFRDNFTIHYTYFYIVNLKASQNNGIFEICRRHLDYLRQTDNENQECLRIVE